MTAEVSAQHICPARLLRGLHFKANETATIFISFGGAVPLPQKLSIYLIPGPSSRGTGMQCDPLRPELGRCELPIPTPLGLGEA